MTVWSVRSYFRVETHCTRKSAPETLYHLFSDKGHLDSRISNFLSGVWGINHA